MLEPAQIDRMTTAERLQAMEQLWEALCKSPSDVLSPSWHGCGFDQARGDFGLPGLFRGVFPGELRLIGGEPDQGRSWDSWSGLRCLQFANKCAKIWAVRIR
jgi:hypothetical protein